MDLTAPYWSRKLFKSPTSCWRSNLSIINAPTLSDLHYFDFTEIVQIKFPPYIDHPAPDLKLYKSLSTSISNSSIICMTSICNVFMSIQCSEDNPVIKNILKFCVQLMNKSVCIEFFYIANNKATNLLANKANS